MGKDLSELLLLQTKIYAKLLASPHLPKLHRFKTSLVYTKFILYWKRSLHIRYITPWIVSSRFKIMDGLGVYNDQMIT